MTRTGYWNVLVSSPTLVPQIPITLGPNTYQTFQTFHWTNGIKSMWSSNRLKPIYWCLLTATSIWYQYNVPQHSTGVEINSLTMGYHRPFNLCDKGGQSPRAIIVNMWGYGTITFMMGWNSKGPMDCTLHRGRGSNSKTRGIWPWISLNFYSCSINQGNFDSWKSPHYTATQQTNFFANQESIRQVYSHKLL